MPSTRIVFLGTPGFAVPILEQIVGDGYDVAAVVTQPDRPAGRGRHLTPPEAKVAAQQLGLPVLQPASLRPPEAVQQLADLRPEVIVVAAFGQLLRKAVLNLPPKGCVNVHPSLLPRHRGASPIAGAILAGDEVTGTTIMLMDPGMDTGPILTQRGLGIDPEDTTGSLGAKLAQLSADLLSATLPEWIAGRITPRVQDEDRATVTRPLTKGQGALDWREPAEALWRRIRAYQPWPSAFTVWKGRLLKILSAWPVDEDYGQNPGKVVRLPQARHTAATGEDLRVGIQTGAGTLALRTVQPEGRRTLGIQEFLAGNRDFIDSEVALPPAPGP